MGKDDRNTLTWARPAPNVPHYQNHKRPDKHDRTRNRREITEYFDRRRARLSVVATTETPRGQLIDWVPIESQGEGEAIARPPSVEPEPSTLRRWADDRRTRRRSLAQ